MTDLAPELAISRWFNVREPPSLAALRGKVVVLHAFQMLCPACVAHGTPQAEKLHRLFSPGGQLVVLGLHTVFEHHAAMTETALAAFIHEYRLTLPIGVDRAGHGDPIPQTMRRYGMQGTPTTIVVDREGRIRQHAFGQVDDLALRALVGSLVSEPLLRPVASGAGSCHLQRQRMASAGTKIWMIEPVLPLVLIGGVEPLGPDGPPSGIDKHPAPGPWRIGATGLEGDAQGDLKHHGGPEKALHHYPREHYAAWSTEIGDRPVLSRPGAFGENLSTTGWTERDVCVGDVVRFGSALLQVSQGRQPCFKLDRRFGRACMAMAMQATGRTGWYWRVLEEGTATPGDSLEPIARPRPAWPLSRLLHVFYVDKRNREALEAVAALPELAEGWRKLARRRMETGIVEDWSRRLNGPDT